MSLKQITEDIVKLIVLDKDAVEVQEGTDRAGRLITITVAPSDRGKVIGKEGRVISCIRQVVGAAGAKAHTRVMVKVATD
ncbi:MAG: KH domain-containing protein [Fimbriimonadaceae bacterium]|nr:KH domain-containing protein [Fimbriimonadaceae bacterium]